MSASATPIAPMSEGLKTILPMLSGSIEIGQPYELYWQLFNLTRPQQMYKPRSGGSYPVLINTYGGTEHSNAPELAGMLGIPNSLSRDWVLMEGLQCLNLQMHHLVDDVIFGFHQKNFYNVDCLISVTFILKHHTLESVRQCLKDHGIAATIFDEHPLSLETRPIVTLSFEVSRNASGKIIWNKHSEQPTSLTNFFKGIAIFNYLLGNKSALYSLINEFLLITEHPWTGHFVGSRALEQYPMTEHLPLLHFRKQVSNRSSTKNQELQQFLMTQHHIIPTSDPLPLHQAIKNGDDALALEIVRNNPEEVLKLDDQYFEPCEIALQRENTSLLKELLFFRKQVITPLRKSHSTLLKIQELWEWASTTQPWILTVPEPMTEKDRGEQSFFYPIKRHFSGVLQSNFWRGTKTFTGFYNQEFYETRHTPRPLLHQLIIEYNDQSSQLITIQTLLDKNLRMLNAKDFFGFRPLFIAAALGHYKIVDLLIALGANTNTYRFYNKIYSLMHNARDDNMRFHLLRLGVSPNDCTDLLNQAWEDASLDMIKLYLLYKIPFFVEANGKNRFHYHTDGSTLISGALTAAARSDHDSLECFWFLLAHFPFEIYAGPYDPIVKNNTALMTIISHHNARINNLKSTPPAPLRLKCILPIRNETTATTRKKALTGIFTLYVTQEEKLVTSIIQQVNQFSSETLGEIYKLYQQSFESVAGTSEQVSAHIAENFLSIIADPHLLMEVSYIDGHVAAAFLFSLEKEINSYGQRMQHFIGRIGVINPTYSRLNLARLIRRVPLALALLEDKSFPESVLVTNSLLQPGMGMTALENIDDLFPIYCNLFSQRELNRIYTLTQKLLRTDSSDEIPCPSSGLVETPMKVHQSRQDSSATPSSSASQESNPAKNIVRKNKMMVRYDLLLRWLHNTYQQTESMLGKPGENTAMFTIYQVTQQLIKFDLHTFASYGYTESKLAELASFFEQLTHPEGPQACL